MAIDIVARPSDGIVTMIHDDPDLHVDALAMAADGALLASAAGRWWEIGVLTRAMAKDVRACFRAAVIRLSGHVVAEARAIPLRVASI